MLADGPDGRQDLSGPVMIVLTVRWGLVVVMLDPHTVRWGLVGLVVVMLDPHCGPGCGGRLRPGRNDGVRGDGPGGDRVVEGEVSGALLYLGVLLLPGGLVGAEDRLEATKVAQHLQEDQLRAVSGHSRQSYRGGEEVVTGV